ncbi:Aconitate hydratase [Streptococcus gordonii]|uniref:Aconitate hydratase A n=1 Tax=Streptococcus gordonii TaxID=1302 RepID=A0A139NFP0_STRGN|nr:Aconitate hydratase [Streptococcus gordonii]
MDLMPEHDLVADYVQKYVTRQLFEKEYAHVFDDNEKWNQIPTASSQNYQWNQASTYIQNPPYFDGLADDLAIQPLKNLAVLAKFGDTVTTDHISPAGNIARNSPVASYLLEHGVDYQEFNSYGSRRGNHEVMMRGTFANIRIKNELADGKIGGYTDYKGELLSIYEAAMRYKEEQIDTVVLAGKDYGMGSNLVMMGILPLQYLEGENAASLGLTGKETFDINLPQNPQVGQLVDVVARKGAEEIAFQARLRFDAEADIRYYENGGILPMVVRKKLEEV